MPERTDEGRERRCVPFTGAELRVDSDDEGGRKLVGLAIVYGKRSQDLGGFVEVIAEGAATEALKRSDIAGLFNHEASNLLGRSTAGTLRVKESKRGVEYEIDLEEGDQLSDFVARKVKRKEIRGNSFSFRLDVDDDDVQHWERQKDGVMLRTVRQIEEIFDVGPVTFPAYRDTVVSARSVELAKAAAAPEGPSAARRMLTLRQRLLEAGLL